MSNSNYVSPGVKIWHDRPVRVISLHSGCHFLIPEREYDQLYNGVPLDSDCPRPRKQYVQECCWVQTAERGDVARHFTFIDGEQRTCHSGAWVVTPAVPSIGRQKAADWKDGLLIVVQTRNPKYQDLLLIPATEAGQFSDTSSWTEVTRGCSRSYLMKEHTNSGLKITLFRRRDSVTGELIFDVC